MVIKHSVRLGAATVAFTNAVTERGLPYADVDLRLDGRAFTAIT